MANRKNYPEDIPRDETLPPDLKPWKRRPNEGSEAYGAFKAYCLLGHGRSTILLADRIRRSVKLVRRWSARWDWQERVRHWDEHMLDIEQGAKEKARANLIEKWERRKIEAAEANWERAQLAARKATQMMEARLHANDEGDGPTAKWNMGNAAQLMKLAAELEQVALHGMNEEADDGFDPAKATPEECREYVRAQGLIK